LEQSRFGYLSRHYVIGLRKAWKKIPGFSGLDFKVEIQVRTLSQHIWAAASHVLQYKKEADVPPAVARSIHRVAALLETVDLEFERVLDEREVYARSAGATESSTVLDADNIKLILDKFFPPENKQEPENYSALLSDLRHFKIVTVEQLRHFLEKHREAVVKKEKETLTEYQNQNAIQVTPLKRWDAERVARGVFYTHVGLARVALGVGFGEDWDAFMRQKFEERERAVQQSVSKAAPVAR
jgi:putative GTP pyrophosphokinase